METIRGAGVEGQLRIPIFDLGEARLREAQEQYGQAVNRLTEKAVNIRSEARAAYQAYRGAYDIAQQYQSQVLPLRQIVSDEAQLRYNGMLTDLFQLLVDTRAQIDSNVAAIEAQRDFWIVTADLSAAISGGSGLDRDPGMATAIRAHPSNGLSTD